MSPTKTLIVDAVTRFPLESTAEWAKLAATEEAVLDRIETDCSSISTVDCYFDGNATVFLKGSRAIQAMVFGRFDGRRAEIERIVLAH